MRTGRAVSELVGHTNDLNSVAFSPDGQLVVTASADGMARVWKASTGQSVDELRGHTAPVTSAAFSPDGQLVVTASVDGTARVWDVATGRNVVELRGHTDRLNSAAFSPDGKLVVTAGGDYENRDNTARVWEASTGRSVAVLDGHIYGVAGAAFSPDGKLVVTADGVGTARLWDAVGGRTWPPCAVIPFICTAWPSAPTGSLWSRPAEMRRHECGMFRRSEVWPTRKAKNPIAVFAWGATTCSPPQGGWCKIVRDMRRAFNHQLEACPRR